MTTQFGTLEPDGKGGARVTNATTINVRAIPSDDPLAFAYGFQQGLNGVKRPRAGSEDAADLAEAFVEGHKLGFAVRKGKTPMPTWAQRA